MDITFESNFGCFDYTLRASLSDEIVALAAGLGLGQLAQRVPSTNAEKEMVGGAWPKNKKGEPMRPKGFERGSIEYSAENAEILKHHLESFFLNENDYGFTVEAITASISERVDKVESKWAYEKGLIKGKNGDVTRLMKLADKVGYEAGDEFELIAENEAFCAAIRAHNKALLAKEMAD
jgi:hypothetical protein